MSANQSIQGKWGITRMDSEVTVKRCAYPNCENTILANGEFIYCEICRTLSNRNSVAILLDPAAPFVDRRDMIFHSMVHSMRPDEIQNAVHKVEWIYLELRKALSRLNVQSDRLKSAREMQDEAHDIREQARRHPAPKAETKRNTKLNKNKEKLKAMFGDKTEEILGSLKDVDTDF